MDAAIEAAVAARFPRPGERAPDYRRSDYHVKQALANVLAPLPRRRVTCSPYAAWNRPKSQSRPGAASNRLLV